MFEKIIFNKKIYAIIIKNKYSKKGANFLTENSLSQQVAHMKYKKGHKIKSHFHKKWVRKIETSMEALFIKSGNSKCALVVGSETMSRIIDWEDRNTCVLFGDGAGAVILEKSSTPGILSTHIHADGAYQELLSVPAGISSNYNLVKSNQAFIKMQGNEVFKVAVNTLGDIVDETLKANSMENTEIDWLVPHQANTRIISAMAKKLDMSMDRVVVTVDQHGNTSAASIPLALDVAVNDGRIKNNDKLLLPAFGGGFTWGSVLLQY